MIHSQVKSVKSAGQRISDLVVRVILTGFYFVFLTPIALWQRLRGSSSDQPVVEGAETFWSPREPDNPTLEDAHKAY